VLNGSLRLSAEEMPFLLLICTWFSTRETPIPWQSAYVLLQSKYMKLPDMFGLMGDAAHGGQAGSARRSLALLHSMVSPVSAGACPGLTQADPHPHCMINCRAII